MLRCIIMLLVAVKSNQLSKIALAKREYLLYGKSLQNSFLR